MALTIEMASLSEELLEECIRERLPTGWTFEVGQTETDLWLVQIFSDGVVAWKQGGITPKLVLLHALGWLEIRNHVPNPNSPWAPRKGEITSARVHEAALRYVSQEKDPEDLDPVEVAAVYPPRRGG